MQPQTNQPGKASNGASTFLSLSPYRSSVAAAPGSGKGDSKTSSISDIIEPTQKARRSGSDSSSTSVSGGFLRLNPDGE